MNSKFRKKFNYNKLNFNEVKQYIEENNDINIKNDFGKSLLMSAIKNKNRDINLVKYLIDNQINVNIKDDNGYNALMITCLLSNENMDIVELLLKNGIYIDEVNKDGYSALMLASIYNKLNIVIEIIKCNPDLNKKSYLTGNNALILAKQNGNFKIVNELLMSSLY